MAYDLSTEELSALANELKVPLSFVMNTYAIESSSGKDMRRSSAGARGPFQLMPATFNRLVPGGNIDDPKQNARAGVMYLREGIDRYGEDPDKVSSFYYGGENERNWGPKTKAYSDLYIQRLSGKTGGFMETGGFRSPGRQDIDFSTLARDVSGSTSNAIAAAEANADISQGEQDRLKRALEDQKKAAILKGSGEQDLYAAMYTAASRKAAGVSNTLAMSGLNDEDISSYWARSMQAIRMKTEQLMPMKEGIRQKKSSIPTFAQDPVRWFMGNLDLSEDVKAHNALQVQVNQESANLDRIIATTNNLQQVNIGKKAYGEAAEAMARGKISQAATQDAVAKFEEEAAKTNLNFAAKRVADLKMIAEMHINHYNVLRTSADAADQSRAKKEKQDADAAELAQKNIGLAHLGKPPASSLQNYLRYPKPLQMAVEVVLSDKLGFNAYESYSVMSIGDSERMPPATRDMYRYLAAEAEKVNVRVQNGEKLKDGTTSIAHMKADEQNAIKSGMITDSFISMQKDITKTSVKDKSNPYQAPTFETLIQRPRLADTKLGQSILIMKQAQPHLPMEPKDVINQVKYMLSNGQYQSPPQGAFKTQWTGSIEAAVNDLEIYFQEIMSHNNEYFQFQKWNLPQQFQYGIDDKNYADRAILIREMVKHVAFSGLGPRIVINPFSPPK